MFLENGFIHYVFIQKDTHFFLKARYCKPKASNFRSPEPLLEHLWIYCMLSIDKEHILNTFTGVTEYIDETLLIKHVHVYVRSTTSRIFPVQFSILGTTNNSRRYKVFIANKNVRDTL